MLGYLGTGLAGTRKGCPGVALPLLQSVRIAPHQEKEGRKDSLHPWGLRRATDGQAGPRYAVPKPGLIPKFSLPSLVMSCLSLLHSQACRPTPAVTQSTLRTMSLSQPRPLSFPPLVSALNWVQGSCLALTFHASCPHNPLSRGGGVSTLPCRMRGGVDHT